METINEEVEEVRNEEGTEEYRNEVIEEGTKQEDKEAEAPKTQNPKNVAFLSIILSIGGLFSLSASSIIPISSS